MFTALRAALALAAVATPGAALAQDHRHQLQDGRILVIMPEVPQCPAHTATDDPRFAINLAFGCDGVGDGQVSGDGAFVAAVQPGQTTPRGYLTAAGEDFWPSLTEAERESQIAEAELTTPSGPIRFLCISAENADGTYGAVRCVLDQPHTQVMLGAEAATRDAALATLNHFLGGVAILPAGS